MLTTARSVAGRAITAWSFTAKVNATSVGGRTQKPVRSFATADDSKERVRNLRPQNWRELGFGTAESRLIKRSVRVGDCLEFSGAQRNGIAQVRISAGGFVWTENATRLAFLLWVGGDIADGQEVQRACGNLRCIERSHLALTEKGRFASEIARQRSLAATVESGRKRRLLSPRQASTVRRRVRDGRTLADLPAKFGVSDGTIYNIANGFLYRDGEPKPERGEAGRYRRDSVYNSRRAGT